MKTIEFKEPGKWAENDTLLPQFEVEAGEQRLVSNELADIVVEAKKGKVIHADKTKVAIAQKVEDDAAAEQKEKDEQAAEQAKVEELKAQVLDLVEALELNPKDVNVGLDSEGLEALVKDLAVQQEEKVAAALAAAEEAEKKAADDKKAAAAKKTPAAKDKAKAESK